MFLSCAFRRGDRSNALLEFADEVGAAAAGRRHVEHRLAPVERARRRREQARQLAGRRTLRTAVGRQQFHHVAGVGGAGERQTRPAFLVQSLGVGVVLFTEIRKWKPSVS